MAKERKSASVKKLGGFFDKIATNVGKAKVKMR
jgi:hypothetical protein